LDSGKAIASFAIACNRNKEEADFFQCEAWEKTAEIVAQYCRKGSQIGISGRLKQERWDDRETQQKRSRVVISAMQIELLGGKPEEEGTPPAATPIAQSTPSAPPAAKASVPAAQRQPVAAAVAQDDYLDIPF
jgi:single-strand DNA-binding protein